MAFTKDGPELMPEVTDMAQAKNYAAVTTVFPSGLLQTQIVWIDVEDGQVVFNTEVHRAKYRNLEQDNRVTVLIRDEDDPYHYAEVRGRADHSVTGQRARDHIDKLSQKYTGHDYPPEGIKTERVMVFVQAERQTVVDQNRQKEPE